MRTCKLACVKFRLFSLVATSESNTHSANGVRYKSKILYSFTLEKIIGLECWFLNHLSFGPAKISIPRYKAKDELLLRNVFTRPAVSHLLSFQIRRTTFLIYIRYKISRYPDLKALKL